MGTVPYILLGTQSRMNAVHAQIEARCPARSAVVGGPDALPQVYSVGAAGWTSRICERAPYLDGSLYRLDVPAHVEVPVEAGKQRALTLAIGESGMAGYWGGVQDWQDYAPAGYPLLDGAQWRYTANGWTPIKEPTHLDGGFGPAGIYAFTRAASLGSAYEVGLIPCALAGTTSERWAVGGELYTVAAVRTIEALQTPGTFLDAIILEHGVNDAYMGLAYSVGWASRWSAIESALRADLSYAGPVIYSQMCTTRSVNGGITDASWAQIRAEQESWQSANRIMVQKPDGPWIEPVVKGHLEPSAMVTLGQRMAAARATIDVSLSATPKTSLFRDTLGSG